MVLKSKQELIQTCSVSYTTRLYKNTTTGKHHRWCSLDSPTQEKLELVWNCGLFCEPATRIWISETAQSHHTYME